MFSESVFLVVGLTIFYIVVKQKKVWYTYLVLIVRILYQGGFMKNAKQSSYIPAVDFWKFIFSIVIMCYHANKMAGLEDVLFFKKGYILVEFFFMVSGFFMAKSLFAAKDIPIKSLGDEAWSFTLKKANKIYIPYLVAFIIHFVIRMVIEEISIKDMLIEASLSIRELTLTYSSGLITGRFHNGPTWYISAMILGMFIIYPILRKYYDTFSKIIAPFFSLFIYAYLQHQYKSINLSSHFGEVVCLGFLRGVCALCIGIFIFQLVTKATNAKIELSFMGKAAMLLTEFVIVAYLMLITFHKRFASHEFQYFSVILQAALVFILFYNPVKIKNNFCIKLCKRLGELSLYIYLNHRIWTRVLETAVIDEGWGRKQLLMVYFALTGISVIASWAISFVLERYKDKIFGIIKKIFTKKQVATEE